MVAFVAPWCGVRSVLRSSRPRILTKATALPTDGSRIQQGRPRRVPYDPVLRRRLRQGQQQAAVCGTGCARLPNHQGQAPIAPQIRFLPRPTFLTTRSRQLFPRGGKSKALDFDGPNRSASAFYYWASRNIPHNVKKVYHLEDLPAWVEEVCNLRRSVPSCANFFVLGYRTKPLPALFSLTKASTSPCFGRRLGTSTRDRSHLPFTAIERGRAL